MGSLYLSRKAQTGSFSSIASSCIAYLSSRLCAGRSRTPSPSTPCRTAPCRTACCPQPVSAVLAVTVVVAMVAALMVVISREKLCLDEVIPCRTACCPQPVSARGWKWWLWTCGRTGGVTADTATTAGPNFLVSSHNPGHTSAVLQITSDKHLAPLSYPCRPRHIRPAPPPSWRA